MEDAKDEDKKPDEKLAEKIEKQKEIVDTDKAEAVKDTANEAEEKEEDTKAVKDIKKTIADLDTQQKGEEGVV